MELLIRVKSRSGGVSLSMKETQMTFNSRGERIRGAVSAVRGGGSNVLAGLPKAV